MGGPVAQITIGWDMDWNLWCDCAPIPYPATVWYAWSDIPLVILGACFPPGELVTITICDLNCYWAEATTNDCGAFAIFDIYLLDLDVDQYGYLMEKYADKSPVSVRAWVNAIVYDDPFDEPDMGPKVISGELWANWPLYIYGGGP